MGKSKGPKPSLYKKNQDYSFGLGTVLCVQGTQTSLLRHHSVTTEKLGNEAREVFAHAIKSQGHIKYISVLMKTECFHLKQSKENPNKQKQNNKKRRKN